MGLLDPISESGFPIGMRNVKTTAAVFACLITYWLIGREDSFLALTSAIICMQTDVESSLYTGIQRLAGTAIGAVWGMILRVVYHFFPYMTVSFILASVGIMLLIFLCNLIKQPESIVMASVVFLAIVLGESGDNPVLYSLNRILDTAIGIAIAIFINHFLKMPASIKRLFSREAEIAVEPIPSEENKESQN